MSNTLFNAVKESADPRGRVVYICKDGSSGHYVYKPQTGFKSKSTKNDDELQAMFERQIADGHTHASYLPHELADEAPKPVAAKKKTAKK